MKRNFTVLLTILICSVTACQSGQKKDRNMDQETKLKIETTAGDIIVKLYNETPQHRDNFIKLAEEGTYEGTLFHRVIKDFMIQAGDPESKNAPKGKMLGAGDVGYTIPAEFVYPKYFHKKGALSAARQGDNVNPKKESSGCQFYIVTGKVYNDTTLLGMENQMNQNRLTTVFNALAQKHMKEIYKMRKENDQDGLMNLQDSLFAQAEAEVAKQPEFHFTPEQVKAYTTVGGTPHLDGEYTVFGEVIEGMDIVDKIQQVKTDRSDRPEEDVETMLDVCHQQGFFLQHEKGLITSAEFRNAIREQIGKVVTDARIDAAWNSFLGSIPTYKLDLLLKLREKYVVYLLSNTNEIHWKWSCKHAFHYKAFRVEDYFERIFLSYEMKMVKPDVAIFEKLLEETGIDPKETFFIDDSTENCRVAESLGISTYTPKACEDWSHLFS